MTKNTDKAKASAPETRKGDTVTKWRTIPAEKPTGVAVYYGDELPPRKTWLPKPPTLQEHIADLMDAATRFEDRAKRAEAHADALAEALRELSDQTQLARKYIILDDDNGLAAYHATAKAWNEARAALAAYESEARK